MSGDGVGYLSLHEIPRTSRHIRQKFIWSRKNSKNFKFILIICLLSEQCQTDFGKCSQTLFFCCWWCFLFFFLIQENFNLVSNQLNFVWFHNFNFRLSKNSSFGIISILCCFTTFI